MTIEGDSFLLGEFDWNAQTELYLLEAMIGLKPVGLNKHFEMASICDKFVDLYGADIESDVIWKHLGRMYNIALIEENNLVKLQSGVLDYNLPDPEYTELLVKKEEIKFEPIDEILHTVQKGVKDYTRNKEPKKIVSRKNSISSDTPLKKEVTDVKKDIIKKDNSKKKSLGKAESEIIASGQKDDPLPSSRSNTKIGIKRTLKRTLRSRADDDSSNTSPSPAQTPPPTKRARRI